MTQRFFVLPVKSEEDQQVREVTQEELASIKGNFVREIDDSIFPLQEEQEIKDYFMNLSQHPSTTRELPGFELIRHK